jgi:predicted N-formylglutamate amidohydrolase
VVTCEHGGNSLPARYRSLIRPNAGILRTHRALDPGALQLARAIAAHFRAPLAASTTTRLLVDLNRSPDNPELWSPFTAPLPAATRAAILRDHYRPFRRRALRQIRSLLPTASRPVLHLSVHTFTPVLRGVVRRADVGLLFDPRRPAEHRFCLAWQRRLRDAAPPRLRWNVRLNDPYRGDADGHTTTLRRTFPPDRYLGIELEVNQRLVRRGGRAWLRTIAAIVSSLDAALAAFAPGAGRRR